MISAISDDAAEIGTRPSSVRRWSYSAALPSLPEQPLQHAGHLEHVTAVKGRQILDYEEVVQRKPD